LRQAYDYWQNQPGNNPRPRPEGQGSTPRRRRKVQGRAPPKQRQPPIEQAPRVRVQQAAHSIAPTEFPKRRSATKQGWRCRLTSPPHTTLRRREYWLHHAHEARLCSSIIPKRLVESWQSQQSTDPRKGARRRIDRTSGVNHKSRRIARSNAYNYRR
jgi:hypothetical protein